MKKKPYLVDVPVRVTIWIRPECQKKQFEVLRQARPSILFVQSDGGRNEQEWQAISENRKLFNDLIDWDCEVHRLYENENQGMYTMGIKTHKYIWNHVDRCIFLEDDDIPAISFFRYCSELLEKYKDDLRIDSICGFNTLNQYDVCSSDYFFSRQGAISGTAMWKRSFDMRDTFFMYGRDPYIMKLLNESTKKNRKFRKRMIAYTQKTYYEGHIAGTEFYKEFAMYGYNQLQIIPKKNLISNIGANNISEHADELCMLPHSIRKIYNSPVYEIQFPMKHPSYVIPDIIYEKKRNRVMGYNTPIITFSRKIERVILKLLRGDVKYIITKIKNLKKTEL